jgi:hypothetical protein
MHGTNIKLNKKYKYTYHHNTQTIVKNTHTLQKLQQSQYKIHMLIITL